MQYKVFMFLFVTFVLVSCDNNQETKAIISVKDLNGVPVQGATVSLSQSGQISPSGEVSNISDQQITDAEGKTIHVFELEKVLNIEVQKTEGNDFYSGFDVIRLVKNETVFKTVQIN